MKSSIEELIETARKLEREKMKTEIMLKEIEQLDDELDDIIAKTRALIASMEDNEDTREVSRLFEEYVRRCQEKGIVRR